MMNTVQEGKTLHSLKKLNSNDNEIPVLHNEQNIDIFVTLLKIMQ